METSSSSGLETEMLIEHLIDNEKLLLILVQLEPGSRYMIPIYMSPVDDEIQSVFRSRRLIHILDRVELDRAVTTEILELKDAQREMGGNGRYFYSITTTIFYNFELSLLAHSTYVDLARLHPT